jgi:hypothetical protein
MREPSGPLLQHVLASLGLSLWCSGGFAWGCGGGFLLGGLLGDAWGFPGGWLCVLVGRDRLADRLRSDRCRPGKGLVAPVSMSASGMFVLHLCEGHDSDYRDPAVCIAAVATTACESSRPLHGGCTSPGTCSPRRFRRFFSRPWPEARCSLILWVELVVLLVCAACVCCLAGIP